MTDKKNGTKTKKGSWICSKGHSTGGRASVCKVCGEAKPPKKQNTKSPIDLRESLRLISEVGGFGTLKQLVADAKQMEEKLAPFGGIRGAEQAIDDVLALEQAMKAIA